MGGKEFYRFMDYEDYTLGAEDLEVADPEEMSVEEGAEGQEPAEPVNSPEPDTTGEQRRNQDAAFAEMRRRYEEAERRSQQIQAQLARTTGVLREMGFRGDTDDYVIDSALAHMQGRSVEDVRAERLSAQQAQFQKDALVNEIQELRGREAARMEEYDISVFSKLDPDIKSMADIGAKYPEYFTALQRYAGTQEFLKPELRETLFRAAMETRQSKEATVPPKIGKVNVKTETERDYFTNKELDNLTGKELDDPVLLEKAIKSLTKLKAK